LTIVLRPAAVVQGPTEASSSDGQVSTITHIEADIGGSTAQTTVYTCDGLDRITAVAYPDG